MSLVSSMLLFNQKFSFPADVFSFCIVVLFYSKKKNPVLACVSFGNKTNHFSNGFLLHFHARKKKKRKRKRKKGMSMVTGTSPVKNKK
jgi:hypothetical protein